MLRSADRVEQSSSASFCVRMMTRIVSSPAIVPSMPSHCIESIEAQTAPAMPL